MNTKIASIQNRQSFNNVLIVGSGAIGMLWYSHFIMRIKQSVNCYLYQSPNKAALASQIHFTTLENKTISLPSQILGQDTHKKIDVILLCVKSYQVNQAIEDIKSLIGPNTIVIISHNGLGALNTRSSSILTNNIVLDLLTTHGCLKRTHNDIVHTGAGVSHIGVKFGQPSNVLSSTITQQLNAVLPEVQWADDLLAKQWLKLAINCVINPLTALFDISNGDVTHKRFNETINTLINEIVLVAKTQQISLESTALKETVLLVAKNTANNSSSMRCDVQQERPTEIEYINGYIHRLGQEFNIPTPQNTALYHQVLAL